MADLTLYNRPVATVFDLLGRKEDDITHSVGWGLAQSEAFARVLLREVYGDAEQGEFTAVRLQESETCSGRTDIEVETERLHLIVEAKRGWTLPSTEQLTKYATRLAGREGRDARIAVVAECAVHYPPVRAMPSDVYGIPVRYVPWSRIAALTESTAASVGRHAEKRLLRELLRYLRGLMTMQNVTSNMVYVVVLNDRPLEWSSLTFKDTVVQRGLYYHPVGGGPRGWPRTPPNYLGFRFRGRLQQIRHVEGYEVITQPHDHIPEIREGIEWEPHFLYHLGPVIRPAGEVRTGKLYMNQRVWCALDLLLTCETIREARDKTTERLASAGEL